MFPTTNNVLDLSAVHLRAVSRGLLAALVVTGLLLTAPARAGETPAETVQTVNDALLHVMQNAEALGFQGRQTYLTPVLTETFDLPAMARLAAGRYWDRFDNDEKRDLVAYFTDLSISTFAARFDGYSGETWRIEGTSQAPRGGTIVENRLITGGGETIAINYLMRQTESGDWRIIDVYLDGNISELALRRSEFNSVLRNGGVDHLLDQIAQQVGRLSNTPQTN
ncbi:MAG: ABC transporter substrate-binding protein [Kiloniellales bacterium]